MKYEETVAAVNRVIGQYSIPLTLRQIYYRLVAAGLIPNRRSAYNGLSAQLVRAREAGEVDEIRKKFLPEKPDLVAAFKLLNIYQRPQEGKGGIE